MNTEHSSHQSVQAFYASVKEQAQMNQPTLRAGPFSDLGGWEGCLKFCHCASCMHSQLTNFLT